MIGGDLVWCFGLVVAMACQQPSPTKPTVVVCPPVIEWKAADQAAAADALAALPASHPLRTMAVVTVKQRDVVRACQRTKRSR